MHCLGAGQKSDEGNVNSEPRDTLLHLTDTTPTGPAADLAATWSTGEFSGSKEAVWDPEKSRPTSLPLSVTIATIGLLSSFKGGPVPLSISSWHSSWQHREGEDPPHMDNRPPATSGLAGVLAKARTIASIIICSHQHRPLMSHF